jgi:Ca2+-transporting ATPase
MGPREWNDAAELLSEKLGADLQRGLSPSSVQEKRQRYGSNELPEAAPPGILRVLLRQFGSFIVWMLLAAALLAGALREWADASAIGAIVLLNALIGCVQELRAERSLAALKRLAVPLCKVVRSGSVQVLPSKELVPGDLVLLEAGDWVPADGRIVQAAQLSTQEASLTGESLPVRKSAVALPAGELPLGDRVNMAFMGTVVLNGKGRLLVTATGRRTELGKIASLLNVRQEESTPLQKRLRQLGTRLVVLCLSIVALVFVLGMMRGNVWLDVLLTATSLAVAAVPEGLPAVVTIALAVGVRRMAKRRALVRRLPSVETLGCASVICTDKTGTLTKNEMSVRKIWTDEREVEVSGAGYVPEGAFTVAPKAGSGLMLLLEAGVLCNSAHLEEGEWRVIGDPTEGALLVAARKAGIRERELQEARPLLGEIPFDAERKCMSMLRSTPQGSILFVKGAPDLMVDRCRSLLINGKEAPLTPELKRKMLAANHAFAEQALRVLAVAYKPVTSEGCLDPSMESDLIGLGLVAMMDSPRPEAKQAVLTCMQAGILPIMITGDHKDTAAAVAREVGLAAAGTRALSGAELQQMSDEELWDSLPDVRIYARISAEDKLRVVRMWKRTGAVVAVTGDGVNDAPAVKEADIGIAMGIQGTDVTKEAADMIITDDDFASIVHAVEEGRGIYDNIIKFVHYLLSSNLAELLVVFVGMAVGFRDPTGALFIPLTAVQLLFLNFITDGFPAIALGMDPVDPHAMRRPPRKSDEPILSWRTMVQLIGISVVIASGTLATCYIGLRTSAALGQTMALTTLVASELVRVHHVRAQYHLKFFSNKWILGALASSFSVHLLVLYAPPLRTLLGTVALSAYEWIVVGGAVSIVGAVGHAMRRLSWRVKQGLQSGKE